MNEDMTFCTNKKCTRTMCARHPKHIALFNVLHSFADLDGTEYCIKTINAGEHHEEYTD